MTISSYQATDGPSHSAELFALLDCSGFKKKRSFQFGQLETPSFQGTVCFNMDRPRDMVLVLD